VSSRGLRYHLPGPESSLAVPKLDGELFYSSVLSHRAQLSPAAMCKVARKGGNRSYSLSWRTLRSLAKDLSPGWYSWYAY